MDARLQANTLRLGNAQEHLSIKHAHHHACLCISSQLAWCTLH